MDEAYGQESMDRSLGYTPMSEWEDERECEWETGQPLDDDAAKRNEI